MFKNAGTKLKKLAIILFVLEIIAAVIWSIVFFIDGDIALGFVFLLAVPFASWCTSLGIYTIGDTNERLWQITLNETTDAETKTIEENKMKSHVEKAKSLYQKNLITEEEYRNILSAAEKKE